MDALRTAFSLICGQGRCFVIDGVPLPVCQRCLGLYVGALLTASWLLGWRLWSSGLPGRRAVIVEAVALATAMLGGLHVLDGGATWRLLCGLWTGHVVMLWLVGGAAELRALKRPDRSPLPAWTKRAQLAALAAVPLLALLACVFWRLPAVGWYVWTMAAALGVLALLSAAVVAVTAVGGQLRLALRR
jgi:uncharacterized membrane protein